VTAAAFELYGLKSCRQPTFQRFNYFNASRAMALKSYMHVLVGLTKFRKLRLKKSNPVKTNQKPFNL